MQKCSVILLVIWNKNVLPMMVKCENMYKYMSKFDLEK